MINIETTYLFLFSQGLIYLTGFIIFVDLFYRLKHLRHLLVSLGWFLTFLGVILFLLSANIENNSIATFFYLVSRITGSAGLYFLIFGVMDYFRIIRTKVIVFLISILITLLVVLFLIDFNLFNFGSFLEIFLAQIILLLIGIKERQRIITHSFTSYLLFLITVSTSIISSLFSSTDTLILFNYMIQLILPVVLIFFILHLEQGISIKEKYVLKDKYSHEMAQFLQISIGNIDLATGYEMDEESKKKAILKAKQAIMKANKLLNQIRGI